MAFAASAATASGSVTVAELSSRAKHQRAVRYC
jgi:hypothetical protein